MSVEIVKTNNCTVIRKEEGKPFRILQLTDIHIGGGILSAKKDKKALEAVEKLIKAATPDLVIITGDLVYPLPYVSGTTNNLRAAKMVGELMTKLSVPWTLVFGNHDAESFAKVGKDALSEYYMSLPNCLFDKGNPALTGCGNHVIRLENADGTFNTLLMLLDSNAYTGKTFFSGFDVIHDDQIEWYKQTVREHSAGEEVATSLAFFHIPPKQFKEAWEKCYRGSDEAQYHLGFVLEKDNYFGYPKKKESNFFDEMVAFGSCKGMFCGHDHLNTLSLTYKDICLTYGMSIDYLAYYRIGKKHTQRGGTIIEIFDDSKFKISLLPLADIE